MKKIPLLLLLLLGMGACAPKQKGPEVVTPWMPRAPLQSLSAYADIDVKARGRTESFQAALLAQGPNRLRIQILDEVGQEQGLLVANGQEVMWWNRREGTQQVLPQDPKVLKKTLHLPLGVEEFVARLLEGTKQNSTAKPAYQIVIEDIQETPNGPYPQQWTWTFRKPKATLSMIFSNLKLNPPIAAEKFAF